MGVLLHIEGMRNRSSCRVQVQQLLQEVAGVLGAAVNFSERKATVMISENASKSADAEVAVIAAALQALKEGGYPAQVVAHDSVHSTDEADETANALRERSRLRSVHWSLRALGLRLGFLGVNLCGNFARYLGNSTLCCNA